MGKWIGRFAVQVEFEAADPNEAREVADRIAENPPTSWGGLKIVGRTPYWVAEAPAEDASDTGTERDS